MMTDRGTTRVKGRIVEHLARQPMTLMALQAAVGASLPTIRRGVEDLIENGWIVPVGQNASTGGRRATRFGLNPGSHLIVGAEIAIPSINMVVTSLDGTVLDTYEADGNGDLSPDEAVSHIQAYVETTRERFAGRQILGIGITTPGYVDAGSGHVLYVGRAPGWENFPLQARLESATGLATALSNDTDSLLRAELATAPQALAGDVLYLAVLEGVKLSMMLNGVIYQGPFGNAGLIGRMKLHADNGYTDLENQASTGAVCNAFDAALAKTTPNATTKQIAGLHDHETKFAAIVEAAAQGDALCREVVAHMLEQLALAAVNVIFILQPSVLIAGGQLSRLPLDLRIQFEAAIRDRLPALLRNHLEIQYARVSGRHAAAVGAAQWFLKQVIAYDQLPDLPTGKPAAELQSFSSP